MSTVNYPHASGIYGGGGGGGYPGYVVGGGGYSPYAQGGGVYSPGLVPNSHNPYDPYSGGVQYVQQPSYRPTTVYQVRNESTGCKYRM